MKIEIYSEISHQPIFTVFDSVKKRKTNAFRVHKHPELELGFITSGAGDYILENEKYKAESGALFLVRPNEQHCVPTVYSDELTSFNIYLSSFYLWNFASEYIDRGKIRALICGDYPISHKFVRQSGIIHELMKLCGNVNEYTLPKIRFLVMKLIVSITSRFPEDTGDDSMFASAVLHRDDIQNAIRFINENLTEPITLEEIAKSAGMSRSHFSMTFRDATGIPPYEYLLLQRIERAVGMLRDEDMTIIEVAQSCGFRNLANFNKAFRKITNMSPSGYRASKRKQ